MLTVWRRQIVRLAFALLCSASLAGCSWNEEESEPTATPDDYFTIVTRVPGKSEPVFVYVVQPGDTLSGIAEIVEVPAEELIELNDLDDPNSIFAGQELLVPTPTP